jgi:hypothetical protein
VIVSAPDDDIPLLPGPGFEKDLDGGQTHSYKISVAANQYLQVVIEQRGINLITTLLDSQGKELLRADNPNGAHGPIYLFAISQTAADYRVEVRSTEPAYRRSLYFDKASRFKSTSGWTGASEPASSTIAVRISGVWVTNPKRLNHLTKRSRFTSSIRIAEERPVCSITSATFSIVSGNIELIRTNLFDFDVVNLV